MVRHPHHGVGDSVGFLLVFIPRVTDGELGLHQSPPSLVADRAVKSQQWMRSHLRVQLRLGRNRSRALVAVLVRFACVLNFHGD
jgi:hypothetical protein